MFYHYYQVSTEKRIRLKKDTKKMSLWNSSDIEEPVIITVSFLFLIYSLTFHARKLTMRAASKKLSRIIVCNF